MNPSKQWYRFGVRVDSKEQAMIPNERGYFSFTCAWQDENGKDTGLVSAFHVSDIPAIIESESGLDIAELQQLYETYRYLYSGEEGNE